MVLPTTANASFFSMIADFISGNTSNQAQMAAADNSNSQNVPLLQTFPNFDSSAATGGGDILVSGTDALVSENGPSGTLADIKDSSNSGQISRYMVRAGDSLASIAAMFGVSKNTIIWANTISGGKVKEGQILVILPVTGTIHTVGKGDTLQSIAKKYKADAGEIADFNDLDSSSSLAVGDEIIIPDGEGNIIAPVSKAKVSKNKSSTNNPYRGGSGPDLGNYYIRPLVGGVKTQGIHGWNGIDIGTHVGTPILAAAEGEIIVAKKSGYNGGYGEYIVISHPNGTQTVYGHLSKVYVSAGDSVVQGQVIGLSGNTGNSTGPHLHFEVRGARNFMNDASEY